MASAAADNIFFFLKLVLLVQSRTHHMICELWIVESTWTQHECWMPNVGHHWLSSASVSPFCDCPPLAILIPWALFVAPPLAPTSPWALLLLITHWCCLCGLLSCSNTCSNITHYGWSFTIYHGPCSMFPKHVLPNSHSILFCQLGHFCAQHVPACNYQTSSQGDWLSVAFSVRFCAKMGKYKACIDGVKENVRVS